MTALDLEATLAGQLAKPFRAQANNLGRLGQPHRIRRQCGRICARLSDAGHRRHRTMMPAAARSATAAAFSDAWSRLAW